MFFAFCNCVASSMFPAFPFGVVRFLVVRVRATFSELSSRAGFSKICKDSKLSGGFAIALGIRSFSRPAKPIENSYSGRYTLLESGILPRGNIRMQFHKYASASHRRSRKV